MARPPVNKCLHLRRFVGAELACHPVPALVSWTGSGQAAIGYFSGSLAVAITIIGIPVALQTLKIGLLCLWPFGAEVKETDSPTGCIRIPLNIL